MNLTGEQDIQSRAGFPLEENPSASRKAVDLTNFNNGFEFGIRKVFKMFKAAHSRYQISNIHHNIAA
jgi:hypothetical protein